MKNIIAVFLMMLLAVTAVPAQDMLDGQPESISGQNLTFMCQIKAGMKDF